VWSNATGPGLFAYTRRLAAQEVFVVFNTAETNQILPACPMAYPARTKLVNVLDENETVTVNADGQTPSLVVPGTSAKIFVAASELRPFDPVVAAISPAHDAGEVSPATPIVIRFSQPMDTASVERAFSTEPPVKGAFSWSPAGDEMRFIPASPGFPPLTLITVHLGDTARSAGSRQPFYAGFESCFRCGRDGAIARPD